MTLGSITVTAPLATGAFYVGAKEVPVVAPDWYPGTPGNDMAFGFEDFEVQSAAQIHALGFELVEPNATMPPWGATPVASAYKVTLYDDDIPVGDFVFNAPDDELAFVGVWSDQAFTRANITDTTGDHDDEYFGEFWSGTTPAPQALFAPLAASGAAVPGGSGVFTGFPLSPALAFGSAAFLGTGSAGSFGIYLIPSDPVIPGEPVQPIADLATAIPGGTGNFTAFSGLALAAHPPDPVIPGDPIRVAFIGTGAGQQGVYVSDSAVPVEPILPVADLTTAIPGGTGTFTGFTSLSASGAHSAFLGLGSLGQKGIYLASALTKVIAVGDTLSGKTVTDLRFGPQGLDGIHLTFTAHFADGTEGVFTVQVASYPFAGFFAPVDNLPV